MVKRLRVLVSCRANYLLDVSLLDPMHHLHLCLWQVRVCLHSAAMQVGTSLHCAHFLERADPMVPNRLQHWASHHVRAIPTRAILSVLLLHEHRVLGRHYWSWVNEVVVEIIWIVVLEQVIVGSWRVWAVNSLHVLRRHHAAMHQIYLRAWIYFCLRWGRSCWAIFRSLYHHWVLSRMFPGGIVSRYSDIDSRKTGFSLLQVRSRCLITIVYSCSIVLYPILLLSLRLLLTCFQP